MTKLYIFALISIRNLLQHYGFIVRPFEIDHLSPRIGVPVEMPMHIAEIGLFQSHGGFRWEQVASRVALHFIRSGKGVFEEDGVALEATDGDIVLFRPGRHYRYYDLPDTPWRYDFMIIEGLVPTGLFGRSALIKSTPTVWPVLEAAVDAFRANEVSFATSARLGWEIIEALSANTARTPLDLTGAVRNFVARRETAFPTVEQIARHLSVDRSTLYRKFRSATGRSVKSWLDDERMARAERLLVQSTATVGEIARICGFGDPLYFSRAFSKRHGMPPGRWRRSSQAVSALRRDALQAADGFSNESSSEST